MLQAGTSHDELIASEARSAVLSGLDGMNLDRVARLGWSGAPTLLVCATGGHLAQLHRLAPRLDVVGRDRLWVTFDTPQSRSLLRDEPTVFVPYTPPRGASQALLNTRTARELLRMLPLRAVVSTGSAIAMSFIPLARLYGIPTVYIESAARADGPSLTGRMLERIPGVERFSQYPVWGNEKWAYAGSVFDEFEAQKASAGTITLRKVVVMLGTIEGYGFPSLISRLKEILPPGAEVVWQIGNTPIDDPSMNAVRSMPAEQLATEISSADLVIAHAGIGSALGALEAGKCPVLVPRRMSRQEHVDDHQLQIASELDRRGLAVYREVDRLSYEDLARAARRSVRRIGGTSISTQVGGEVLEQDRQLHARAALRMPVTSGAR